MVSRRLPRHLTAIVSLLLAHPRAIGRRTDRASASTRKRSGGALRLGLWPTASWHDPSGEHARNASLGPVFDHVGIAVSDLAASERFYRTVLSVLGVEPSHADAEL